MSDSTELRHAQDWKTGSAFAILAFSQSVSDVVVCADVFISRLNPPAMDARSIADLSNPELLSILNTVAAELARRLGWFEGEVGRLRTAEAAARESEADSSESPGPPPPGNRPYPVPEPYDWATDPWRLPAPANDQEAPEGHGHPLGSLSPLSRPLPVPDDIDQDPWNQPTDSDEDPLRNTELLLPDSRLAPAIGERPAALASTGQRAAQTPRRWGRKLKRQRR